MRKRFAFDRAYYDRYYRDPRTRVGERAAAARLGDFVAAYLRYLEQPVRTVVDFGCGLGHWRRIVRRHFPGARYTGVELSAYLCRTYGWTRGSVIDWTAETPADFVVCHGVLQYLDAAAARHAIANLARNCAGVLFLEALTREDWARHCDRERTDGDVYLRPASWYRGELRRWFMPAGGGLFVRPDAPVVLYELEAAR
jgi:SAM-dependent methyltransferase